MTQSPPPPNSRSSMPSRLLVRIALGLSSLLLLAAAAAFYWASQQAGQPHADDEQVAVVIRAQGCEPATLTVPAGRTVFRIDNQSQRAVEWEILDGVMVMEERENIAPGYSQTLAARLPPGDYAMTCGLLSNPRGTLHVSATDASRAAQAARPALAETVGALAEYRVYLALQARRLRADVQALLALIERGDLAGARARYAPARQAYQRIEASADAYSDLDARIDGQADYLAEREQDPAFAGFHRIELGLFGPSPASATDLLPVAQALLADVDRLTPRLGSLTVSPERMLAGAAKLAREMADNKLGGQDDRYAHTELWTLQANLDGLVKIASLMAPFLARTDAALADSLAAHYAQAQAALASQRLAGAAPPAGFPSFDTVGAPQRLAMQQAFAALAVDLGQARDALALE